MYPEELTGSDLRHNEIIMFNFINQDRIIKTPAIFSQLWYTCREHPNPGKENQWMQRRR